MPWNLERLTLMMQTRIRFPNPHFKLTFLLSVACISMPHAGSVTHDPHKKNILGTALQSCSLNPKTGFYRDGFCATGLEDSGVHVVCSLMTKDFLEFSKSRGNDLITPHFEIGFTGLKPGDRWCLCADRWKEAFDGHLAPPVIAEATHEKALRVGSRSDFESSCAK